MSWEVPTAEDCPYCGKSLFKKSGKGQKKTFCINAECENFTPEELRPGYRKKKTEETGETSAVAAEAPTEKKTTAKKTTTKKTTTAKKTTTKKTAAKKTATTKKATAKKTTAAKKTTTTKTAKKKETGAETE